MMERAMAHGPAPVTQVTILAVVVGAGVVAALQVGKGAIAAPMVQADLGIDLAMVGWLTSVFAVLGLVGGMPAGAIVTSWGDRQMLLLGLWSIVLGAAAGSIAPSFGLLLVSRVVEGLGFLMVSVAGPAILQRLIAPERRDGAMALWSCFMPAGMAIAMFAAPLAEGWRTAWWASAVIAIIALAGAALAVPQGQSRRAASWQGMRTDLGSVLRSKGPMLLGFCFALYSLMFFALFSFLPVLLMERLQVPLTTAGLLSALATASNIAGNLWAGVLLSRGWSRPVIVAGTSLAMAICALGVFLPLFPPLPTFALAVLFSGLGGLIPATLISSAPILAPTAALTPLVVGLIMQGSNLGQVIGPVAVGHMVAGFGWAAAAGLTATCAALAILGAALLTTVFRTAHR